MLKTSELANCRQKIDQTELLSNARTVLRRSIESSVHLSVVQTTLSNACN